MSRLKGNTNQGYDVVVVGAGITGASTAYHLKKLKLRKVLLLERNTPASGGTGKSAAIVRQHYSTPLMARLARASIDKFETMAQELGRSGGYEARGYYLLVPGALLDAAKRNVEMQKSVGVNTRFLTEAEVEDALPWLNPDGVAGVIHEPRGGCADSVRTTEAYVGAFESMGGEVRLKTPCRGLLRRGDAVVGVVLEDGPVHCGAVVNAAGCWAHCLARSSGIELNLRILREQDTVWQARPERPLPQQSVSNAVDAIYVRPMATDRFVIGRGFPKEYQEVDPYNFRQSADEEFITDILTRAELRFPPLTGMKLLAAYAALYDVTPDWYPFVGPRRGLDGYYDACGGSGHGFKIGPAIGEELAEWIVNGAVKGDFAQLSYDRLVDNNLFVQAYGGNRG